MGPGCIGENIIKPIAVTSSLVTMARHAACPSEEPRSIGTHTTGAGNAVRTRGGSDGWRADAGGAECRSPSSWQPASHRHRGRYTPGLRGAVAGPAVGYGFQGRKRAYCRDSSSDLNRSCRNRSADCGRDGGLLAQLARAPAAGVTPAASTEWRTSPGQTAQSPAPASALHDV